MTNLRDLDDYDEDELDDLVRAARMFEHLRGGGALQPMLTSVRTSPGESAFFDEVLIVSRYYGEDPMIERPASYLSPRDVAGAALRNWYARREAAAQWRDPQRCRVVLTDQRLLILVAGQWLEFSHAMLVEFQPAPVEFQVILTYGGTPAVRLNGHPCAVLAVALANVLDGADALAHNPAFQILTAVLKDLDA